MILMSDTGGGHRASADAIKAGFHILYGDKYEVRLLAAFLPSCSQLRTSKAPCNQGVGLRTLPRRGPTGTQHRTASSGRAGAEHLTASGIDGGCWQLTCSRRGLAAYLWSHTAEPSSRQQGRNAVPFSTLLPGSRPDTTSKALALP